MYRTDSLLKAFRFAPCHQWPPTKWNNSCQMLRFTFVSLRDGGYGSKLGLELQIGNKIVPLRNGRESAAELFTTLVQWPQWIDLLVSPSFLARHSWNLRARDQSRESGRNQSFLFQEVQLLDMHSVPLQRWQIVLWHAWKFVSHILWEWQLSE